MDGWMDRWKSNVSNAPIWASLRTTASRLGAEIFLIHSEAAADLDTLQIFWRELLFSLPSKNSSSLLSITPLTKKEGVKFPPPLLSRNATLHYAHRLLDFELQQ